MTGADGAAGANCVLPGDTDPPWCFGGNGGSGESVTATGNPAAAYGGNGGPGGFGASFGSRDFENDGYGGPGGSAMAMAVASAASGDVAASTTAVGGSTGAGNYHGGGSWSGDASASAIATSGDVIVQFSRRLWRLEVCNPAPSPCRVPPPTLCRSLFLISPTPLR